MMIKTNFQFRAYALAKRGCRTLRASFFCTLVYIAMAQEVLECDRLLAMFTTASGKQQEFSLEIAKTLRQRSYGLMFRRDLPDFSGMIFIYDHPHIAKMWMKDTPLSLDILFLDSSGVIREVHPSQVPYSTEIVTSAIEAAYAIELKGGTTKKLGILVGSQIRIL